MQVQAPVINAVEVIAIRVKAEVRYWEDATVNGNEDTDGTLIPLRNGAYWEPVIELDTGRVRDWPDGTAADIHYKVCDQGEYLLLDSAGQTLACRDGYVPDMLCVGDNGYGDYIILQIGPDGMIQDWPELVDIEPERWEWQRHA